VLTLAEFNVYIRPVVASKWYDLGVQLLPNHCYNLDNIKANNPGNVEQCCTQMYRLWLQLDLQASQEKLAIALQKTGFDALAERVMNNSNLKGMYTVQVHVF